MIEMTNDYQVGTTILLQAVYKDQTENLIDADELPTVEVLDGSGNVVQTGLVPSKTVTGTYQMKFNTEGLSEGTYFHRWTALFSSYPDIKSGEFILVNISI